MNKEELKEYCKLSSEQICKQDYELRKLQQENKKYKEAIDKAIDKLYCWGEALNPEFQKIMLDILKEVK